MPRWKLPTHETLQTHATPLIFAALALLLALGVMLFIHPPCQQIPYRDSGVFLYTGQSILQGGVPYRDVWDHKPPVIFFLNALGLLLGGGSPAGVYFLEGVLLALGLGLAARMLLPRFGRLASAAALLLAAYSMLFLNQAGNLTTGFALPMQFLAFWLFLRLARKPGFAFGLPFLIGLLLGLLFLTKQNLIGIGLAIALTLLILRLREGRFRHWLLEMLAVLAGAACLAGLFVLYFALNNALADFWDAAFVYNFYEVAETEGLQGWLLAALENLQFLGQTGLLQLGLIGWAVGVFGLFHPALRQRPFWLLVGLALVDLPIELLLVNLSDNSYAHYFLGAVPVLTILAALAVWLLNLGLRRAGFASPTLPRGERLRAAALALILVGLAVLSLNNLVRLRYCSGGGEVARLTDYIRANSAPDDTVLFWGAETALNFATARQSPTRYTYQYPLYTAGYTSEARILEFLDDLAQDPPQIIVDTHRPRTPFYAFPIQSAAVQARSAELQARYRLAEVINDWEVYLLIR